MGIAGCEFTPGITDADNGFVPEFIIRYTLVFHPRTVDKTILAFAAKPVAAS